MASNRRGNLRRVERATNARRLRRAIEAVEARTRGERQELQRCLHSKMRSTRDPEMLDVIREYLAKLLRPERGNTASPVCRRLSRERSCWY